MLFHVLTKDQISQDSKAINCQEDIESLTSFLDHEVVQVSPGEFDNLPKPEDYLELLTQVSETSDDTSETSLKIPLQHTSIPIKIPEELGEIIRRNFGEVFLLLQVHKIS